MLRAIALCKTFCYIPCFYSMTYSKRADSPHLNSFTNVIFFSDWKTRREIATFLAIALHLIILIWTSTVVFIFLYTVLPLEVYTKISSKSKNIYFFSTVCNSWTVYDGTEKRIRFWLFIDYLLRYGRFLKRTVHKWKIIRWRCDSGKISQAINCYSSLLIVHQRLLIKLSCR